jgi:hypothetical protein
MDEHTESVLSFVPTKLLGNAVARSTRRYAAISIANASNTRKNETRRLSDLALVADSSAH